MSADQIHLLVGDLLTLAIAEPEAAMQQAEHILASDADPSALSVARQALGIVLRHRGLMDDALRELRAAVRLAHRSRDVDREADARATLGVTLAMAGRTRSGLDQLNSSIAAATDPLVLGKALVRRAHVRHYYLAEEREALVDLEPALVAIRAAGERVWEARTLNVIGGCHLALGHVAEAERAIRAAEAIFTSEGQRLEAVITLHNRGSIAFRQGDLPLALTLFDLAAEKYADLGMDEAKLVLERCQALLTAGLADEAVELVRDRVQKGSMPAVELAELVLVQASAELAADEPGASLRSANKARVLLQRQGREWNTLNAELAVLLAKQRVGSVGPAMVRRAADVAARLEAGGADDAAVAWLLAGRSGLLINASSASELLGRAARYRRRDSGLVRASAWHASALARDARGEARRVLSACRRGLDALDEHRATLGSSELRALATRHGDELAALALRHATHSAPRVLLEWSERWRATALTQPPVHPPDDAELAQSLAALRDTRRRLAKAQAEGSQTAIRLDEERARLERAIRQRTHHLAGTSAATTRFRARDLVDSLDGTGFVELVDIDGVLHALVARSGRVTHLVVGPTTEAEQAVAFARFALRQTARGRPTDLVDVGHRLQVALLGDAVRRLGDGPVVVSPPGRLHATPWALVPALTGVPISVAPSAALWLRARASAAPSGARVLIAGPGLESGGAELDTLALRHPDAMLLRGVDATVERSLEALDGAAVAHVAAHGRFREDSPLFSSLDLDDGPLTVHDFERLGRAPHRIVLSACESGVVAPIGAGEMLGLVSAMLAMGSAGIVSSVAKVNDQATAELMLDVHAAMDDGEDLGEVLLRARQAARGDRVREATAAAFLAMGV
ncbi:MAG TPA: CHAT domain-containing protein [Nocardioides sp.]|nr:CHAT domain-containing protein [Nocardioides sp.]